VAAAVPALVEPHAYRRERRRRAPGRAGGRFPLAQARRRGRVSSTSSRVTSTSSWRTAWSAWRRGRASPSRAASCTFPMPGARAVVLMVEKGRRGSDRRLGGNPDRQRRPPFAGPNSPLRRECFVTRNNIRLTIDMSEVSTGDSFRIRGIEDLNSNRLYFDQLQPSRVNWGKL